MKSVVRLLAIAAWGLFALAAPASAQYMYLDSNGDGVHTAADQLNANGAATSVDVYIITNQNRDGSTADCVTADGELTINSYQVAMQASGGTVSYSGFVNQQALMTTVLEPLNSDATDFVVGQGGGTAFAAGKYRLMSLTITGVSGAPAVSIIPDSPLNAAGSGYTAFGTLCSGNDFDNTYKLVGTAFGTGDWTDVDGLAAAPGGNLAPAITVPATVNGSEGSVVNVTASSSDPDGNNVTLSQTNNAPFLSGLASAGPALNPSITLTGTPNFTQSGTYTVNWSAVDDASSPGTANATTSVVIANTDRPPLLAAIATLNVAEGATASTPVSASDPDGDFIALAAVGLPAFAALQAPTSGAGSVTTSISASPNFAQSGTYPVTVNATANGLTASQGFDIVVANTNRTPTIVPIADINVAEGASASSPVSATDADGEALTLTSSLPAFASLGATSGTGSISTNVTASPGFSDAGSYPSSVTVSDPSAASNTANFTINVSNTDRGPALDAIANVSVAEGGSASRNVNASDPDGDVVELTASLPSFAVLNPPINGAGSVATTISINPAFGDAGSYPSSVTATSLGLTQTRNFTINVTQTNQPVTLAPIADINTVEGGSASTSLSASDPDADAITLSASLPGFATLTDNGDGTGSITANPGFSDAGSYPSSATATSADATSDTKTFDINVQNTNRPVTLAAIANLAVAEGGTATRNVSASDPDGDAITLAATGTPSFATFTDNGDGTGAMTASPVSGDAGTYPVTVTANSADATSDSKSFDIVVTAVDQPVALDPIGDINVAEGASASTPVNASDADGETITLTAVLPSFATLDAPTSGAGAVATTVTASPGFSDAGSYPSSVTASAGPATDTENFTIDVGNTNRPVTLAPVADINVAEGASGSTSLSASDPDGEAITLAASLPAFATLTDNGDGTGSVTANPGFSDAGSYAASATATSADATSDTRNFDINVSNTNRPVALAPIANLSVLEGASATRNVSASDPDGEAITLTDAGTPSFATFTDNGDGTGAMTASPSTGDAGTYPVTVTAASADGTSDAKSFDIIVTRENRAPVLDQPSDMTLDEGDVATQQLTASDPDADPLTFSKVGTTPFFMAVSAAGLVTLSPGFTDAGAYTGTARVSDGSLNDTKSFSITVNDKNRCPTANAGGPYSGVVGVPVTFNGSGSSDPDGDPLTYTWTFGDGSSPANGATPNHTYAAPGSYTVTLAVADALCEDNTSTTATISDVFAAEAFFFGGNRTTRLAAGKPFTCVNVEPVGGSFAVGDVDLSSIKMISQGTGSVSEIFAGGSKTSVDGDKNGDGITEIAACFSKDDLRLLFGNLGPGTHVVPVVIEGSLVSGGRFQAMVDHTVKGSGRALTASVSPNPLNPEGTLSFATSRAGRVAVKVFDLNGRLVRTLLDEVRGAGYQDVVWNGTDGNGRKVASGVYFFRIDTAEGRVVQSVTVLK